MRLFVAITLPPIWKDALDGAVQALRSMGVRGDFTRRDQFHLTLAFLGETDRLDAVRDAMDRVAAPPFLLRTGALGVFRRRGGDIWWVGLEPCPALLETQGQLADALDSAGFPPDARAYRPHLTLGRQVTAPPWLDRERLQHLLPPMELRVDLLSLMKSERVEGALRYTPIYRKMLA